MRFRMLIINERRQCNMSIRRSRTCRTFPNTLHVCISIKSRSYTTLVSRYRQTKCQGSTLTEYNVHFNTCLDLDKQPHSRWLLSLWLSWFSSCHIPNVIMDSCVPHSLQDIFSPCRGYLYGCCRSSCSNQCFPSSGNAYYSCMSKKKNR